MAGQLARWVIFCALVQFLITKTSSLMDVHSQFDYAAHELLEVQAPGRVHRAVGDDIPLKHSPGRMARAVGDKHPLFYMGYCLDRSDTQTNFFSFTCPDPKQVITLNMKVLYGKTLKHDESFCKSPRLMIDQCTTVDAAADVKLFGRCESMNFCAFYYSTDELNATFVQRDCQQEYDGDWFVFFSFLCFSSLNPGGTKKPKLEMAYIRYITVPQSFYLLTPDFGSLVAFPEGVECKLTFKPVSHEQYYFSLDVKDFDAVTVPPNKPCPYKIKIINSLGNTSQFYDYCADEQIVIKPLVAKDRYVSTGYIRVVLVNQKIAPSKVRMWIEVFVRKRIGNLLKFQAAEGSTRVECVEIDAGPASTRRTTAIPKTKTERLSGYEKILYSLFGLSYPKRGSRKYYDPAGTPLKMNVIDAPLKDHTHWYLKLTDNPMDMYIAGGVGGVLVLAIIIGISWFVWKRKKGNADAKEEINVEKK